MIYENNNDKTGLQDAMKHPGLSVTTNPVDSEFGILNIKSLRPNLSHKIPIWFNTNCFSLTLTAEAAGRYTTRTNSFDVHPGTVFFSRPDIYRQLEWHSIGEICHLTFSERFLTKYAGVTLFKTFPFLLLETVVPKYTTAETFEDLRKIYHLIEHEHLGHSPLKKHIIATLLTRLLIKIKSNFWEDYEIKFDKTANNDVVNQFIKNLEQHYQQLQQGKTSVQLRVNDYAKMQNIHENYLYNVIKEKTGKVISHWIAEKTILVAKNLLEDRSFSIKEVSYRLGFPYFSYFTIFFKKHTGLTPKQFRTSTHQL